MAVLDFLVSLMEDGQFEKCLRLAEQQLLRGGMSRSQLARLNMVICRCRVGLNDPHHAVIAGQLAVKLARDAQDWDTMGRVHHTLGIAYVGTRQYDEALTQFYAYLEFLSRYTTSRRFEGAVWKSIGIAHQRKLENEQAIGALTRAQHWFSKQGSEHGAFGCMHELIHIYLHQNETDPLASLEPAAALLKRQKAIARKYPEDTYFRAIYLSDHASFYLQQGRISRAIISALKAMEARKGDHLLAYNCHMVLHHCTRIRGDAKESLGYALAARVQAQQIRQHELEYLASRAMAEVIRQQGSQVVRDLDLEYKAMGVDLGQFLSPDLLQRPN